MYFPCEKYFLALFEGSVYLCYFSSAKTCIYLCQHAIFVSLFVIDAIKSLGQKVSCFFHKSLYKYVTIKQIIPKYNTLSVTTALWFITWDNQSSEKAVMSSYMPCNF